MKNQDTINRFIQLRAEGWTFGRIADDLDAPKSTLPIPPSAIGKSKN